MNENAEGGEDGVDDDDIRDEEEGDVGKVVNMER